MTNSPSYPSDAEILVIVTKRGVRSVFYYGLVTAVVVLLGQSFLAVPLALFLVAWGLWCAVGILPSFVMAAASLFGMKPDASYDAPRMWLAGIVRLIEGAFYVGYSILLYRIVIA